MAIDPTDTNKYPVPSGDYRVAERNAQDFDRFLNLTGTFESRSGVELDTLTQAIQKLGWQPPVAYTAGIEFTINDRTKTVERGSSVYAALGSAIPFTTTGTWAGDDESKFIILNLSDVSAADVSYDDTASGLGVDNAQSAIDASIVAANNSYDNSASGLSATNVKDAIDEVYQSNKLVWSSPNKIAEISSLAAQSNSITYLGKNGRIVVLDYDKYLTCYQFDGSEIAQIGTPLFRSGVSRTGTSMASLSGELFVLADRAQNEVVLYNFNGSVFTILGDYSFASLDDPVVTAISDTDVVVFNDVGDTLTLLRSNGTGFDQVGNVFSIGDTVSSMTTLTSSKIAVRIVGNIYIIDFDGTDFSLSAGPYPVDSGSDAIVAINEADIMVINGSATVGSKIYRLSGGSFVDSSDYGSTGPEGSTAAMNGADICQHSGASLRVYRMGFSVRDQPQSRNITG